MVNDFSLNTNNSFSNRIKKDVQDSALFVPLHQGTKKLLVYLFST